MTTATKPSTNQLEDLNERYATAARKAGNLYLDNVEKAVEGAVDFQKKLGAASRIEGVQSLVDAQAEIGADVAKAYIGATRELLA
jgi:hypothetical protein